MSPITINPGHLARHTPQGAGTQGRDAAIVDIAEAIRTHYAFLALLDERESVLAQAHEQDRPLALRMLAELPGGRLNRVGLY